MRVLNIIIAISFSLTAYAGQESRGGNGLKVKLFGDLELLSLVKFWDKVEHQQEFMPVDEPSFGKYIQPRLNVLKGKLPRLGHRLETLVKRGINPTWYFVSVSLKEDLEAPQSDLVITYERVQVARNDGQTIRINRGLFKRMSEEEQAWTLMHEMLRSAVEVESLQEDRKIASLTAILMHKNLIAFEKKELAKRLLHLMLNTSKKDGFFNADSHEEQKLFKADKHQDTLGPTSPLVRLIEADLAVNSQKIENWEDHSTLQDGLSGTTCSYHTDQCVFRDKKRGSLYWSEISPGAVEEGVTKTYSEAMEMCTLLKQWGGYSDWRLPTFSELYDVAPRIEAVVRLVPSFGQNNNLYLWAGTSPSDSSWWSFEAQDPGRAWTMSLALNQDREFDKNSLNSVRCVRDDYKYLWSDASMDSASKKAPCSKTGQCAVLNNRTKLIWSSPSPKYQPTYGRTRRSDDLGYVSLRQATKACNGLNWAGQKGWRLPSPDEAREANRDGLYAWSMKHEAFGLLLETVWTVEPDRVPTDVIGGYSFDEAVIKTNWSLNDRYQGQRRYICVKDSEE